MAPAERGKADAWERTVERLFRPGTFIPERACSAFVSDLEELEAEVSKDLSAQPERAAAQVRVEHKRKLGFMADFERLAAGATRELRPTFLERARAQWQKG
jgi:hypothetical protein